MLRFVVRRLILLIPILIALSILMFLYIRALPGVPRSPCSGSGPPPERNGERDRYGLDEPMYVQYGSYPGRLSSILSSAPASHPARRDRRAPRAPPATVELAIGAMIFATIFGIPWDSSRRSATGRGSTRRA